MQNLLGPPSCVGSWAVVVEHHHGITGAYMGCHITGDTGCVGYSSSVTAAGTQPVGWEQTHEVVDEENCTVGAGHQMRGA